MPDFIEAAGINTADRTVTLPDGARIKLSDAQVEKLYLSLLRERIEGKES